MKRIFIPLSILSILTSCTYEENYETISYYQSEGNPPQEQTQPQIQDYIPQSLQHKWVSVYEPETLGSFLDGRQKSFLEFELWGLEYILNKDNSQITENTSDYCSIKYIPDGITFKIEYSDTNEDIVIWVIDAGNDPMRIGNYTRQ